MGQLAAGGGGAYLPDYSVRQLTDLQIIKVVEINDRNKKDVLQKIQPLFLVNVHFLPSGSLEGNKSQKSLPILSSNSAKMESPAL